LFEFDFVDAAPPACSYTQLRCFSKPTVLPAGSVLGTTTEAGRLRSLSVRYHHLSDAYVSSLGRDSRSSPCDDPNDLILDVKIDALVVTLGLQDAARQGGIRAFGVIQQTNSQDIVVTRCCCRYNRAHTRTYMAWSLPGRMNEKDRCYDRDKMI
jgi:hypothetical protein